MSALLPFAVWFAVALIVFAVLVRMNRDTLNDLKNGSFVGCFLLAYLWPVALVCLAVVLPFVLIGHLVAPQPLPTSKPGDSNG